jgi:lysine 2,3-aminomutase
VLGAAALDRAFGYIAEHPLIWEVIVTGGDPFLLSPRRIAAIVRRTLAIPHVAVVRFHTRVPVADPRRVGAALVAALEADKAVYVVIHANHPHELTPAMREAVGRLVRAGIPVLSQSVLLRGVNDDPAVLEALLRGLVAMRVKPYYLHHPDLARGTGHFRLGIADGQALVGALRGRVSGLCQPSYVLDIPGGYGKVPIAASAARASGPGEPPGSWVVEDLAGRKHAYPPHAGDDADRAGD